MEAAPRNGPDDVRYDAVNRIEREIKLDAEKILARPPQPPQSQNNNFQQYYSSQPYDSSSKLIYSPPSLTDSPPNCYAAGFVVVDPSTSSAAADNFGTTNSNCWLPSPLLLTSTSASPAAAATTTTTTMSGGPELVIVQQPVERCRFRYRTENSPHGPLQGADKKKKPCPTVKVENFHGTGHVVASLYTAEEIPRPHINELWGSGNNFADGRCKVELDGNMCAVFSNMGIMRQKESVVCELLYRKYLQEYNEVEKGVPANDDTKESLRARAQREMATMKDCLQSVRLGFQAFLIDHQANGREFSTSIVLSNIICNSQNPGYSELKIAEIDKSCGHAIGGDRIWLRCAAKIRRDQIKVIFREPNTHWEAEGVFSATDVYEQILIIFKTPAFRDVNITERVHVNLYLLRTTDDAESAPVDFIYLPMDDAARFTSPPATLNANNLDSGIGSEAGPSSSSMAMTNSITDLRSRIETLSLTEMNRIGIAAAAAGGSAGGESAKFQSYLTGLWETYLGALWNFSSEGDPEPFVGACKGLIGLQDESGNTSLHVAVKSKQSFALKTMLKVLETMPNKREIIDTTNFKKQTALHLAIRFGDDDCVHYLITSGADRTALDADGHSMAHYLAETFNENIYRDILFPPNESTTTADPGKKEQQKNVDLTVMNNEGINAVHLAVKRKKLALLESLIEAGAPLDGVERNTGKSTLHLAVEANDTDAVELLLRNRVRVDLQSYDGTTALHLAAKQRAAPIVWKLMSAGGADANEKTSSMAVVALSESGKRKAEPTEPTEGEQGEEESEDGSVLEGEDDGEGEGEATELHSAFDFAGDDRIILDILNGKPYDDPDEPAGSEPSAAIGGARPKTCPYVPSTSSKQQHSLGVPQASGSAGGRTRSSSRGSADGAGVAAAAAAAVRRTSRRSSSGGRGESPESMPAFIHDDISTLDYVTRIRLSKLLDECGRWEELARTLECEHMIACLKVCAEAEGNSPTILLLDQLEHTKGHTITGLLSALRERGHRSAVDMIIRKQRQQNNQQGGAGAYSDEAAAAGAEFLE